AVASGASPKSKNAPRQQEIFLVDFASPTQALMKVRVRIDTILYLDYLAYHCIDGAWLITAKSFHIERRYAKRRFKPPGGNARRETPQRLLLLHADDRVIIAGHASIGHVGGAAGK